jgi:hypothetical protein
VNADQSSESDLGDAEPLPNFCNRSADCGAANRRHISSLEMKT